MKNINTKKGFTIIEVVLVLAIAGLIFLMVFVALPSLQSSQRDTQRKNNYASILTAVQTYYSNNPSKSGVPTFDDLKPYVSDDAVDPATGVKYNSSSAVLVVSTATADGEKKPTVTAPIQLVFQAVCADGASTSAKVTFKKDQNRTYAVMGYLESNSGRVYYCQDNGN